MGGFHLVFKLKQHRIRSEIKRAIKLGLPESDLVDIVITESNEDELDWIEGHEFRYRGTMYDIVRTECTDTATVYHCINDDQETLLFANLDELVKKASQKTHNSNDSGLNSFNWLSHILQGSVNFFSVGIFPERSFGILIQSNYCTPDISICAPPPNNLIV